MAIERDKGNMMGLPVDYDRNAEFLEKRLGELAPIPKWRVLRGKEMEILKYPFPVTLYQVECKLEINGKTLALSNSVAIDLFDALGTDTTVRRLQFQFANATGAEVFSIDVQEWRP